ncbi:hypothetical protein ACFQV9_20115 [Actinomadura keratinilytica]
MLELSRSQWAAFSSVLRDATGA